VPFSPFNVWTITAKGDLIYGFAKDLCFSIFSESGVELEVKKYWEKVPVLAEEADWEKAAITTWLRSSDPSWQWDGPPIPDYKPAFSAIYADLSDRIWVQSKGPSIRRTEMIGATDEEIRISRFSAWRETHHLDVFDFEGRYLGPVSFPDEGYSQFSIWYAKEDVVLAHVRDEDDIAYIKRYRLVIPE
jgi:hypothetical protein